MKRFFKYTMIAAASVFLMPLAGCADNDTADDFPNVVIDLDDDSQGYPTQNLGSLNLPDDTVLSISGGTATYLNNGDPVPNFWQGSESVALAFDGKYNTMYHSPYGEANEGKYPVELVFTLADEPESLDYVRLVPRENLGNGSILDVELYIKSGSGDFEPYGSKTISTPGTITFSLKPDVSQPREIKLVVNNGYGRFTSLAEIECGTLGSTAGLDGMQYFTDELCTELVAGTTREQLQSVSMPFFRNLGLAMLNGTYDVENRVHNIKMYPDPGFKAKYNKTAKYGILDNASGMYVDWNDEVVIFVEDNLAAEMTLRVVNPMKQFSPVQTQSLVPGINVFKAKEKGLLYFIYQGTQEATTKVHVATGKVNGLYDVSKHTAADWKTLLDKTSFTHFDILGEYTHLILTVVDLKAYVNNGQELIETYDKICYMEQDFAGFVKYEFTASETDGGGTYSRMNDTRLCLMALNSTAHMFATDYYTGYSLKSLSEIIDVRTLKTSGVWGPAHELGHVNQIRPGFKWGGGTTEGEMTEVTNNVYSLYVQTEINANDPAIPDNVSRLLADRHYQSAFNRYFVSEQNYAGGTGYTYCFEKLVPLWQLYLYFTKTLGNTDFYKDLLETIRLDPFYTAWTATSDLQVINCINRFAINASKTAQMNLTQFFQDYRFLLNTETVNSIAAMGYPAPEHYFRYITDENWKLFKSGAQVVAGSATVNVVDGEFKVFVNDDCRNATAFEIYIPSDLVKPLMVTPDRTFTVITSAAGIVIKAVGVDGTRVDVPQK